MKNFLILTTCALALSACSPKDTTTKSVETNQQQAMTQNQKLDAWFEKTFMEGVSHYPQFLTQLGE